MVDSDALAHLVHHRDGDGWVDCACGRRHWGLHGAAGLLLADGDRVLLQHRSVWSHQGGTWGIPGGAREAAESAVAAAFRESAEEAGLDESSLRPLAATVLDHGTWSYTTILADAVGPVDPRITDAESEEITWVDKARVADLTLLAAFGEAWPMLSDLAGRRLVLVVDSANVVGSDPTARIPGGWWRDRAGAAAVLHGELTASARAGVDAVALRMPGSQVWPDALWWPEVIQVVEGAAAAMPDQSAGPVRVVRTSGHGDDEIVDQTRQALAGPGRPVVRVVTADRELRGRVEALGAVAVGPSALAAEVPARRVVAAPVSGR